MATKILLNDNKKEKKNMKLSKCLIIIIVIIIIFGLTLYFLKKHMNFDNKKDDSFSYISEKIGGKNQSLGEYISSMDSEFSNNKVASIKIEKTLELNYDKNNIIDISYNQDKSVITFLDGKDLYIQFKNKLILNSDSSYLFTDFERISSITGLENFDFSNVKNMKEMFSYCYSLEEIDFGDIDTSNVTNMNLLFKECFSLKNIDLSNFNTSNVKYMHGMFYNCYVLEKLDLSSFDTSKVTTMNAMFDGFEKMETLDLSNFNTSNVTNMAYMFANSNSLKTINVSSFDTLNVTTMYEMFAGCSSLQSIDLSSFDTFNVTDMLCMFSGCSSLTELDLSSFDTTGVDRIYGMFIDCTNLKKIYVGDKFIVKYFINSENMFWRCYKLVGGNGTKYDEKNVTGTYARIDKSGEKGYFTKK